MVGKVIRDYMEGGAKKLTVPGFGTFMRRDEGGVIFVDLLRGDDGVLREMVEDAGNYSEVEAMALIDRYIFETKNTIERHGSATIDGFGTMTLDPKGVYQFEYSPKFRPVKEHAVQERLFEKEPPRSAQPSQTPQSPAPQPASPRAAQPHAEVRRDPPSRTATKPPQRRPQAEKPARRPQSKKSAADTVLIVAIVAAAIALIAMIFGMSSAGMPFLQK